MIDMPNLRSVFLERRNKNYFKDFGPKTVDKMFSAVSAEQLLKLLAGGDKDSLGEITGLPAIRVLRLVHGYTLYRPLLELACYLDENGFRTPIATKVFQVWGAKAKEKIHSNPYRLLAFASWPEVDALGLKRGSEFHACRLVASIENCLYEDYEENKHTYIDADSLFHVTRKLIGCNRAQFDHGLDLAITTDAIISIEDKLQVPAVNLFERAIEKFLLDNTKTGISEVIVAAFLGNSRHFSGLTPEQRAAVTNALTNRFSAYYGRGGCGKTYTLKAIAEGAEFILGKKKVFLAAVAAKAAQKMAREAGRDAITIAHLVHVTKKEELFDSLIIIDEASMLSLADMFQILMKVPSSANIVMLGDPNQIPSIGAGKLFYDIIRTKVIPSQELTVNLRQDEKTDEQLSKIIDGDFPHFEDYTSASRAGLHRLLVKNVGDAEQKAVELYRSIKGAGEDVQIISPLANFPGGSDSINTRVHYELHRRDDYVRGTPVVWTRNGKTNFGIALTNGSVGIVKGRSSYPGMYLEVVFEVENDVHLTWDEVANHLQKAYALSVHKAQGSDWDNVIIVLPNSPRMVDRNMVYTALSRCRKRAIVIYYDHAFVRRQVAAPAAHERRRSFLFSGVQ